MKKCNKITVILLFLVLGLQHVNAQDVGFSQFYANPVYLNPAFAVSKVAPRISLTYRAQWPGLVSAFTTVSASYDQYIPDLHGGIGAIVVADWQGDHGILSTTALGAVYSFRFRVIEDIYINLALQANVVNTIAAMFGADKMGCRLFVEAGSQAEYGTVLTPISEATPCNPFSAYGKAKLEVYRRLSELSAELGIKYLHLRIFSLFGEGDHPWTLVMSSLGKMLRNEAVDLSPCTQHWDFLYVKDAARQIASLCDYALTSKDFRSEVYNIASGDSRPLKDFVERMKVLTGSESKLNYGAVTPQYVVSLQPDMSKTQAVVGKLCEYSFDDVINRMIEKLRNDKGK